MTKKQYVLLLIGIGYVVFLNSFFNGFVWDDNFQLVTNGFVRSGQFFYYFSHTIGPYYKPLMFFIYTLFFQMFQLQPFFYHFFQVSVHIGNTLLLFLLFRYFSKNNFLSFILSLVFLIHPVNEETAVYVANYQDVLYMFFGLSALLVLIKQFLGKYSGSITGVLLLLSLFSKETGILFVCICIAYIMLFRKTNRFLLIIYPCIAVVFYFLIRFSLTGYIHPTNFNAIPANTITAAPVTQRLLTVPKIIAFYLTSFVFPRSLTVQYWYVKTITFSDFVFPLLFDLSFLGISILTGVYVKRKRKDLSKIFWFFFFWFYLGLSLHVNIIPLDFTIADRWFYVPMVGILGMALSLFQSLEIRSVTRKNGLVFFLIGIILSCFALRTLVRNPQWYSNLTLFSHDISSLNESADIQYNYGSALLDDGQYKVSALHLQKAVELSPKTFQAWHNLGIAYLHIKKLDEAKRCFIQEIRLKNNAVYPYISLVYIALMQNSPEEAKKIALTTLQKWPEDPTMWRMLGLAAYTMKDIPLAQRAFQKSLSIAPYPVTEYYESQLKQNLPIKMQEL